MNGNYSPGSVLQLSWTKEGRERRVDEISNRNNYIVTNENVSVYALDDMKLHNSTIKFHSSLFLQFSKINLKIFLWCSFMTRRIIWAADAHTRWVKWFGIVKGFRNERNLWIVIEDADEKTKWHEIYSKKWWKFRRKQHDSMWSPFTFNFYRHLTTLCIKSPIISLDWETLMETELFSVIRMMSHEPTKQSNNQFS